MAERIRKIDVLKLIKECAWDFLCLFLAIFAFLGIYSTKFSTLFYKNSGYKESEFGFEYYESMTVFWKLFWLSLLIIVLLVVLYDLVLPFIFSNSSKRIKQLGYIGFSILIILLITIKIISYCKQNSDNALGGFYSILLNFYELFNYYNDTYLDVPYFVKEYEVAVFFMVIAGYVSFAFMLGKLLKRHIMLLLLPFSLMVYLMVVGLTPGFLFILMIAVLFYMVFCNSKNLKGLLVYAGIIFIGGLIFIVPSKLIADNGYKVKEWQKKMENSISSIFKEDSGEYTISNKINASNPGYSDRHVMTIWASGKPTGSLYLRSFMGSDFKKSGWLYDAKSFERFCDEGSYELDVSSRKFVKNQLRDVDFNIQTVNYLIEYEPKGFKDAAVPYFTSLVDNLELQYDYIYKKPKDVLSYKFKGLLSNMIDVTTLLNCYSNSTIPMSSFLQDYSYEYLKKYIEKSKLPAVENAAKAIEKEFDISMRENVSFDYLNNVAYSIRVARAIQDYFEKHYKYSLKLSRASKNKEYIEYFLEDSKEGYCMHFATAATLILREFGIPARYVSGYIAPAGAFVDESYKGYYYKCDITGYNSHAWVEIYIYGVGWVPFEVTPGYSNSDKNDFNQLMTNPNGTSANSPTRVPKPTNSPDTTNTPTPTVGPTSTPRPTNTPRPHVSPSTSPTKTPRPIPSPTTAPKNSVNIGKILGVVLLVVVSLGLVVIIFIVAKKLYNTTYEYANKALEKEEYNDLIGKLNRKIYKRLRFKRIGYLSNDFDYARALFERYPYICVHKLRKEKLWNEYMKIVTKAKYSNEECTREEAILIYDVYKAIRNGQK